MTRFQGRFDDLRGNDLNYIPNVAKSPNANRRENEEINVFKPKSLKKLTKDEYFLTADLTDRQLKSLDKVLNATDEEMMGIRKVIMKNASDRGIDVGEIILRLPQVRPVLMSYHNPRLFIGDKPGLGKTVMSAGAYAYYMVKCRQQGIEPTKILVVTVSQHVYGFREEWKDFGINLLPLSDGSAKISKTLNKENLDDYDGVICNWDSLKTNGFLEFYLENSDKFDFAVFDETSKLLNDKSQIYKVVNAIVNDFRGGIERVLFLNGSSFEKNIFDFYFQFGILKPKLIPTKKFLEDRYIIRSGRNVFMQDLVQIENQLAIETIQRKTGEIVDYRNQAELRDRLKYYYIARSKSDYSTFIPKHNHILNPIELTREQSKKLADSSLMSLINSPRTSDKSAKFDRKTSPKLDAILDFANLVADDRPILYVYNKESQRTICDELTKMGYKVEILSGDNSPKEKKDIQDRFNNKELDMLVFNIDTAMNIPTSDRILFYDIPLMPQKTSQVKGRIDRNNYTDAKFYNFFCYLDSPEMVNIIRLAYFREHHGNEFTGQVDNVYKDLLKQLHYVYTTDKMIKIEELMDGLETDEDFEEIRFELEELLL